MKWEELALLRRLLLRYRLEHRTTSTVNEAVRVVYRGVGSASAAIIRRAREEHSAMKEANDAARA